MKILPVNHIVVFEICLKENLPVKVEDMDEEATMRIVKKLAALERQIIFLCATRKIKPQIRIAWNFYENEFKEATSFRRVYGGLLCPAWKGVPFIQLKNMLLALFDQNELLQRSFAHVWILLKTNRLLLDGF